MSEKVYELNENSKIIKDGNNSNIKIFTAI